MSKAEVMVILILFHAFDHRCLKHFYIDYVYKHMRHIFPRVVSYNRFVELEKDVLFPLAIFIKQVLLGKCTGISFVDSTPLLVCNNKRIHSHKVFKGIATRGKRAIIESVNDELKNIAQIEHSRHRSLHNFINNLFGALAAYCFFPKKPTIRAHKVYDTQLALW